jgi:hypothetical protein
MAILRKVLFWIFAAVYLVTCPLAILYALGYIVEPGAEQGLVKTGLISVSTAPPGASVYLGHRRYTGKTPTVIRDLLPGDYLLKLTLKDRAPWTRTVAVEAEKATVLNRVLLLPRHQAPTTLLPELFEELVALPQSRMLLLSRGQKLEDLVVYDMAQELFRLPVPPGFLWGRAPVWVQAAMPESAWLLLRLRTREGEKLLGVDLEGEGNDPVDLTAALPERPDWVGWNPRAPRHLYAVHDGTLSHADLESGLVDPSIARRVRGAGLCGSTPCILSEGMELQRLDQRGRFVEVILHDSGEARSLLGTEGFFRITELEDGFFLFEGERGELVVAPPWSRLVDRGLRGFAYDRRRHRLLLWRKDRIGVFDVWAWREPEPQLEGPVLSWVFREGRDIAQAFWVYEGSHALFRDGRTVSLLELETPGEPAPSELLQAQPRSAVAYDEATGTLYGLDRLTKQFSSLVILPDKAATAP